MSGRPKLGSPKCREPNAGNGDKKQIASVGAAAKRLLSGAAGRWNVDLLQITDGIDAEVQINLK